MTDLSSAVGSSSSSAPQNTHTIFVDDEESARNFDAARAFDCPPAMLARTRNRLRKDQLKHVKVIGADNAQDVVVSIGFFLLLIKFSVFRKPTAHVVNRTRNCRYVLTV